LTETVTITDLVPGVPSASATPDVLKITNIHDLQVYSVILTVLLCLIVFGGVKIINKVAPAFLFPVLLSVLLIFIGILAAPRSKDPRKFSYPELILMEFIRQPLPSDQTHIAKASDYYEIGWMSDLLVW